MNPDLPQGSFIDTSGGPYLTFKAAKKSVHFCGLLAGGPIIAKFFWQNLNDHAFIVSKGVISVSKMIKIHNIFIL